MGQLRRRIQVKRAPDRDRGDRVAFEWRITVARSNRAPVVTEGVLFAMRDGAVAPAAGRSSADFGTVLAVLVNERGRAGSFPERIDVHEAPRPDPTEPPALPLTARRGESGLGLGTFAQRAERDRREQR